MTKQQFLKYVQIEGVYNACLFKNAKRTFSTGTIMVKN